MSTDALPLAPYRDASLPIEDRVADLLGRMTLPEKLAQLGSFWAFEIVGDDGLDEERLAILGGDGIGSLTRLAGSTNLRPLDVARTADAIQRFLVEETRLGIPALIHEECLHGLLAWAAPCFQQSIGAAAAFDTELVAEVAGTIRRRMLMTGARHALGPVLDIGRDPRWGRIEETYGEDPYLSAELSCAYIAALQGDDLREGVAATGKHLVGHGLAEGGMNQAPAHIGPRELADEQLFPFEAAVRTTGLASMMPAYCDVDGLPCHASHELLTTTLRKRWGFDGIVSSDYIAVEMLATAHRLTDDLGEAARLALEAGVDSELPRTAAFGEPLVEAIEAGRIDVSRIDAAVARMLRLKFRLGLFERPRVQVPTADELAALEADELRAASELARRSLVLVANDGILPLAADTGRIAVVGPLADSARDLLGDYSHLVHIETLQEQRVQGNALGIDHAATKVVAGELDGRTTILDAIRSSFPASDVRHAAGGTVSTATDRDLAEAVAVAADSDVAIVVLGERSGLTDDATTGEFRDRRDLGFSGRQQELLDAVAATGTPVVLVVVSGRPLTLERAASQSAAILLAWVPGDAGPAAIADALAGVVNPGGKLPISMPRHVGQVPLSYRHHPTGGHSQPKGDYVDGSTKPLWPFGYGLSYTTFELCDLRVDRTTLATDGGTVTLSVDVANTGARVGDEVVQLYIRDEQATVARPVIELRGYRRLTLEAGERRTVTFTLSSEQLCYTGADLRRVVEPGTATLSVGTSSADRPLSVPIELVGPVVEVVDRRDYLTPVRVD